MPAIAIVGSVGPGADAVFDHGINAVFSIVPGPCSLDEAIGAAVENLERTARNVAAALSVVRGPARTLHLHSPNG